MLAAFGQPAPRPVAMDGSEGEEVAVAMRRVQAVFHWTYPIVGVLSLVYVGFGDAVFGAFNVIGRRLPLRALLREAYHVAEVAVASALHTGMLVACRTNDACTERPMHRRWCMIATSVAVVAYAAVLVANRGIEPLLKISHSCPGHAHGMTARVFNAAAVCAGWICVAECETLGVALLLAATARRALAPVPLAANVYIGLIKLYALVYTFWILHNPTTCHASSRRAPVAVMGTILAL